MLEQVDQSDLRIFWVTRKSLVFALALAMVGAVLIFSVTIPQIQVTRKLYADLEKEKPVLEKLESKLAQLEAIVTSPEYAQVEIINEALPSKKPLLEYLMGLSQVSQATNVVITNFETSPGLVATDAAELEKIQKSSADVEAMKLELELEGDWAEIQAFMLKVEEIAPFTTITKMDIGNSLTSETVDEIETFQASLSTETYFFTKTIQSKVDSPLPVISDQETQVLYLLAQFVPTELPNQTEIRGGGLEDLFQLRPDDEAAVMIEDLQIESQSAVVPSAPTLNTPAPVATPAPTSPGDQI